MTSLSVIPVLLPLLSAALILLWRQSSGPRLARVNAAFTFTLLISSILLWTDVWRNGTAVHDFGGWPAPNGIVFVADLFSATLIAVSSFVGFCTSLFLIEEMKTGPGSQSPLYFVIWQALLMGVNGSFLSGDLFNLFVWFEVMLMSSFVLMVYEGGKRQIEGTIKYTAINFIGSFLFLSAAGLIYGATGTLNLAEIAHRLATTPPSVVAQASFALLLIAFGTKAGVFPLYSWLPASYHTPRFATSALLAGLLTKVGVYTLVRINLLGFAGTLTFTRPLLLAVAAMTMLLGVLGAASQTEIRRILSFHIISQIGYMVLGLALMTRSAISAAVFYIVHHIIVKSNLFLVSGAIHRMTGTSELQRLGGIASTQPLLAAMFLIPALSLAGMPPLSGFFAKLSIITAGFAIQEYAVITIALFVGLLTLFSMMKIWLEAFWKPRPTSLPIPLPMSRPLSHHVPLAYVVPIALMAAVTLAIGTWPEALFDAANRIAAELMDPNLYIDAVMGRPK